MLARKPRNQSMMRLRPLQQGRFSVLLGGLLVTLLAVFFLYYPPELLRFFDFRVYDLMIAQRPPAEAKSLPIIVGIDEASLAEFGQWPWPRYRLAQLLMALQRQGVAAIGLDILMPEADRTSLETILHERQRDLGEVMPADSWMLPGQSNDDLLAEAIATAPVVLASKFLFANENSRPERVSLPPLEHIVVAAEGAPEVAAEDWWPEPQGVLVSLESLTAAAKQLGFTNAAPDRDGVLRRLPLLLKYQQGYFPSLALATLMQATGEQQLRLEQLDQEARIDWHGRQLPLDARGRLLLGFSTQPRYRYISAADLLLGRLSETALAGGIVFVGAWSAGLGDRHLTPLAQNVPGVELHAVAAATVLNGDWNAHPVWARGLELLGVICLGLASSLVLGRYGLLPAVLLLLGGSLVVCWGSAALFSGKNLFIAPTMPVLVLLVNTAFLSLLRYGIEAGKLRQRTQDLLKAQDATIVSLTTLADTRDNDTGAHILRTQGYVKALARRLQKQSRYQGLLTDEDVEMLSKSAPLHDIGKVGIPDRILLKTGELTAEERQLMQDHTRLGAMALARTAAVLGHPDNHAYLQYARQMSESHHERWDGSGYPYGLQGEEIPLAGRLMALADVYDALISQRSYKEAFSHLRAREVILAKSGHHFDPQIVAAFLESEASFQEISAAYHDELLVHATLSED